MNEYSFEIPLKFTVSLGNGSASAAGSHPPTLSGLERAEIDQNYENRKGYQPSFLGTPVPLPTLTDEQRRNAARNMLAARGDDETILPYHHFSLVMNRRRQLAYFSAVNIDGAKSRNPKRERDRWYYDPRIAESEQIGEELYARNNLDRGHIVRRLDPAWGTADQALSANNDTFHFTNCSPQHANFNQNSETWQGIENFLLGKAMASSRRLTIFTGPVMADNDPLYRGVRLPLHFWKIAVFINKDKAVTASAYLLDQTDLVKAEIGLERFDPSVFQVQVQEISERTGLDFSYLQGNQAGLERAPSLERDGSLQRVRLRTVFDIQM
jgi:endonuclease G